MWRGKETLAASQRCANISRTSRPQCITLFGIEVYLRGPTLEGEQAIMLQR